MAAQTCPSTFLETTQPPDDGDDNGVDDDGDNDDGDDYDGDVHDFQDCDEAADGVMMSTMTATTTMMTAQSKKMMAMNKNDG